MFLPSISSPRPFGSNTPKGARMRRISDLRSAVRSTTTDNPTSGRSSATTFCISAHCSFWAPGGVSHTMFQAPCVALTAAGAGGANAAASAAAAAIAMRRGKSLCAENGKCLVAMGKMVPRIGCLYS
jgi:hypothetical protein